jgi:Cof subfamily protein (haloacid dehalogenase superfamily)
MDYSFLALDIDGTTLQDNGQINPRDAAAIEAVQAHGVHVTFITGRLYTGTTRVARKLGVTAAVGVMNGSELRELSDGSTLHGHYLDVELRSALRDVLSGHALAPFLFASDEIHHSAAAREHLGALRAWTHDFREHEDLFAADHWHAADDILAVVAAGTEADVASARDAVAPLIPDWAELLTFGGFHSPLHVLKVRSKREDKGSALGHLAARRGETLSNCVAVGDWFNDLPMLQAAGRSFAMGQAHPAVKAAATDSLKATSTEGGGIAEVVETVWGLKI